MRVIKRSGARDLPPMADDLQPAIVVQPKNNTLPGSGNLLKIKLPCDLQIDARVISVEHTDSGWIGWATQVGGDLADFRARGVPVTDLGEKFRIFSWQVVDR